MMIYPRPCTNLGAWAFNGLASKPYPRRRGETGVESTSGGL